MKFDNISLRLEYIRVTITELSAFAYREDACKKCVVSLKGYLISHKKFILFYISKNWRKIPQYAILAVIRMN